MNILGHSYVAFNAVGRFNKYLATGAHLPDLVPFVPSSVFSFEEIHEGGERFLQFLKKNYPGKTDLALGMMAHSVKYGADKFNHQIEGWLIGNNKDLRKELACQIADGSGISLEVAEKWIHNYLWAGVDVYLLKNKPRFVKDLVCAHREINREEITRLLAEYFRKDQKEVRRMVNSLFGAVKPENLLTLAGLVEIWQKFLAGLLEKNSVDKKKTNGLFKKIYILFEQRWGKILERVVADVKENLVPFV